MTSTIGNKRSKPEDFVGWMSDNGNLEVVEFIGKNKSRTANLYKVTCKICSEDKELFPNGYFISRKGDLVRGQIPCGCGRGTRWSPEQYLIRARRAGKDRFIVHGFAEEFHGYNTKVSCECLIDGHLWNPSLDNIVNNGNSCPACGNANIRNARRLDYQDMINRSTDYCKERGYTFIKIKEGANLGVVNTHIEFYCDKHGLQTGMYHYLVNMCWGCKECGKENKKLKASFMYGYYTDKAQEEDYLYIVNFNNEYIKVGRTFKIKQRIKQLKKQSKCKNVKVVRLYSATHKDIFEIEQETHRKLNDLNMNHKDSIWSTETFNIESLSIVLEILEAYNLKIIT